MSEDSEGEWRKRERGGKVRIQNAKRKKRKGVNGKAKKAKKERKECEEGK